MKIDTRFQKGLAEVPAGKQKELRQELMEVLRIKDRHSFYNYRDGKVRLTIDRWVNIQATFAQYGVSDPWGGA